MTIKNRLSDLRAAVLFTGKWLLLTAPVGFVAGSACALFLFLLDSATQTREQTPWLIFFLPLAGAAIGGLYLHFGKSVEAGNNLVVDEIHRPGGGVPLRMTPLVLLGTVVTHLFGGSAGREGTAVQMGGSIASGFATLIPGLPRQDVRILLMAGIAAGFGGVFGTPVAGAVFALEVLLIGRLEHAAMLPCLLASIVSDQTCVAWGIGHTSYQIDALMSDPVTQHLAAFDARIVFLTVLSAVAFGIVSCVFSELAHAVQSLFRRLIKQPAMRPFIGGVLVLTMTYAVGTTDYLGLGVTSSDDTAVTIVSCFQEGGATPWSWLWKLLFTVITVGSGFKGGEVTPLFFIGAATGNVLAFLFEAPVDLMAGMGFLAVFAGATNTPLACTVMGIELFGGEYTLYFAVACFVSYLCSGHSGIYASQRLPQAKLLVRESEDSPRLGDIKNSAAIESNHQAQDEVT